MGEVYRARDTRLERIVAIKVLPAGVPVSAETLERFQREARAASALNHPHICTIYDVGTDPPFIAMELLEGETLADRIGRLKAQGSVLPVDAALSMAVSIADALDAAHGKGIVHRDIKPANIFLTAHGPKILDFGLATTAGPDAAHADQATRPAAARLTDPGSTLGTVSYMSPEQVRAEPLDARTDVFSLGVVLYEVATGTLPFRGDSPGTIFDSILNRAPVAPVRLNPDVPAEYERIIDKCLEKDRDLRYQHASELRTDLRRLKRDTDSHRVVARDATSAQPGVATSGARRSKAIVPAVAAVLAIVVAGYFYARRTPKLTEKDTIVLADFTNTTGDPVFDGTLRQGLAIQLAQSPFLSLVSDERIQRALTLMGQPADARLTPQLAREICERTGAAAFLDGSIASLGSQYVLGLRAKNCHTGDVLDEEQVQAARKEDVLGALSHIASTFRTRVGESLATVEKHDTPLEEATTPSLDALKAYSAGAKHFSADANTAAAVPLLKRAIEIDPKFAMAYASLGFAYGLLGEPALAAENNRKAYELRDRASDREKFFIAATYDLQVTGNLEKALQTTGIVGADLSSRYTSLRTPGRIPVSDVRRFRKGGRGRAKNGRARSEFSSRISSAWVQPSVRGPHRGGREDLSASVRPQPVHPGFLTAAVRHRVLERRPRGNGAGSGFREGEAGSRRRRVPSRRFCPGILGSPASGEAEVPACHRAGPAVETAGKDSVVRSGSGVVGSVLRECVGGQAGRGGRARAFDGSGC